MNDEVVKLMLVSCVVHLIEHIHTGEEIDLVAANGNLAHPDVYEYTSNLAPELLPVRRDGKQPLKLSL